MSESDGVSPSPLFRLCIYFLVKSLMPITYISTPSPLLHPEKKIVRHTHLPLLPLCRPFRRCERSPRTSVAPLFCCCPSSFPTLFLCHPVVCSWPHWIFTFLLQHAKCNLSRPLRLLWEEDWSLQRAWWAPQRAPTFGCTEGPPMSRRPRQVQVIPLRVSLSFRSSSMALVKRGKGADCCPLIDLQPAPTALCSGPPARVASGLT